MYATVAELVEDLTAAPNSSDEEDDDENSESTSMQTEPQPQATAVKTTGSDAEV